MILFELDKSGVLSSFGSTKMASAGFLEYRKLAFLNRPFVHSSTSVRTSFTTNIFFGFLSDVSVLYYLSVI